MFESIQGLEIIEVLPGISPLRGVYRERSSHAFVFKISGESVYNFPDLQLRLRQGELLFIPRGQSYTTHCLTGEGSRYLALNFQAEIPGARAQKYPLANQTDFEYLCSRLRALRLLDTVADRYRLLSVFYEILGHVTAAGADRAGYLPSASGGRIEPALRHLQENLFDPGLKIGTLHTLCGLSDTAFRRLFAARFGATPKKYVLNKRLNQARAILENGEYNSIAETAFLCGFDDPLHFSKVFKRKYGYSPTEYPGKETL